MLQPTDLAPLDITIQNELGQPISLRNVLGHWVVLYFYPKDNTPGCTQEACEFRDANDVMQKLGVTVIGVSKDNQKSHQKFRDQYQLPFPLWSDPDHVLLEAFGAWGERKFMGRIFMGILRSTFVIDPTGHIVKVWEKVTPKNHAAEVLAFLQEKLK
jgi:thioredoxin-dependent peroxiredoxin